MPTPNPVFPDPIFAEPRATNDPTEFVVDPSGDSAHYAGLVLSLTHPIPPPRQPANLSLQTALGPQRAAKRIQEITQASQIVFHAVGDTGSTKSPATQGAVADRMVNDFAGNAVKSLPAFCYHLGDVVYSFGEAKFYYDQFYEPYRNYPAPILAIPGNHDAMVYDQDKENPLDSFQANFCNQRFEIAKDSVSVHRTTQIQPGVYFTFDAPFVRIIGLYSNAGESEYGTLTHTDPKSGVEDRQQLDFLKKQLQLARTNPPDGALLVAVHHPPYGWNTKSVLDHNHGGSPAVLKQIDGACTAAGLWPHAVISGHAHNYQRFTRTVGSREIPYIVCGNSGHNAQPLSGLKKTPASKFPLPVEPGLKFNAYCDDDYGYLRITASKTELKIEFQAVHYRGAKRVDVDRVKVNLKTGKLKP